MVYKPAYTPLSSVVKDDNGAQTVELAAEFILRLLESHRAKHTEKEYCPPLFVGVQGPQGSGKPCLYEIWWACQ